MRRCSRVPSPFLRRIFEVTGLSELLDHQSPENSIDTVTEAGALGTWVEVPTTGRADRHDTTGTVEPNLTERVSGSAALETARGREDP